MPCCSRCWASPRLAGAAGAPRPAAADLRLEGAIGLRERSGNAAAPRRSSSRDGRIVFVGDPRTGAAARAGRLGRSSFRERSCFPGWADAHGHLAGLGKALETADLRGAADAAEARAGSARSPGASRRARGRRDAAGTRTAGRAAPIPDARDLDAAVPDRPAIARRVDGHAVWVNTAALSTAAGHRRLDAATPTGGRILRRADGSPSGVFVDNAMDLVDARDAGRRRRRTSSAGSSPRRGACARLGLTEVQDASGYGPAEIASLEKLAGAGRAADPRLRDRLAGAGLARGGVLAKGAAHRAGRRFSDRARDQGVRRRRARKPRRGAPRGLLRRAGQPGPSRHAARAARRGRAGAPGSTAGSSGSTRSATAETASRSTPSRRRHGAVPRRAAGRRPAAHRARAGHRARRHPAVRPGGRDRVDPADARDVRHGRGRRSASAPERIARRLRVAAARRERARGSPAAATFPVESENPLLGFYAAVTRQDLVGQARRRLAARRSGSRAPRRSRSSRRTPPRRRSRRTGGAGSLPASTRT